MTPFSSWRREHKEGKKRPWEVPAWWRSLSTRTELSILQAVAGLRGVNLGKQYKASNHLLHWSPPLLLFLSLWNRTANVPLIDWDKRLSGCMWEKLMNCMIFSSVGWLAVQSWKLMKWKSTSNWYKAEIFTDQISHCTELRKITVAGTFGVYIKIRRLKQQASKHIKYARINWLTLQVKEQWGGKGL